MSRLYSDVRWHGSASEDVMTMIAKHAQLAEWLGGALATGDYTVAWVRTSVASIAPFYAV